MKTIKVSNLVFDYFYLISLAYPDMELATEANLVLDNDEYFLFTHELGLESSIYSFCRFHKLWASNILEKHWELYDVCEA